LGCPTVVNRVPARLVPALHVPWPLVAHRFDRSSKLPSLHCDHPRCRRWLVGSHRGGLLLLAHVGSCCFAFAAICAPAGERTGASIRLRHAGLRCCGGVAGGKGGGRSYWSWGQFLSGRSALPPTPRPRLPKGNGGPGRLRGMMEMVGGGLAARSEGDTPPHLAASLLPRRGSRAGPPGPRRHLPDVQHNDHSTPPPGLRTRRRDAARRVPAISAPSVHRRTRRERRAPWSSSQRQSSNPSCMRSEFMPIRPVLAGTNASNLTARGGV